MDYLRPASESMSKSEDETRNPKYLLKDKVTLLTVEKKIFHLQPMQI